MIRQSSIMPSLVQNCKHLWKICRPTFLFYVTTWLVPGPNPCSFWQTQPKWHSCFQMAKRWWHPYNNYSMSPCWIWSDKITNERVAQVGLVSCFISNKGEWKNCFSKFSNRVTLPPIFISTILQAKIFKLGALFSIWRKNPTIGS